MKITLGKDAESEGCHHITHEANGERPYPREGWLTLFISSRETDLDTANHI